MAAIEDDFVPLEPTLKNVVEQVSISYSLIYSRPRFKLFNYVSEYITMDFRWWKGWCRQDNHKVSIFSTIQ